MNIISFFSYFFFKKQQNINTSLCTFSSERSSWRFCRYSTCKLAET